MSFCRKTDRKAEKLLQEKSAGLLEELIASCDGKSNPLKSFSAKTIIEATNNFNSNRIIYEGAVSKDYKGVIQDRMIMVKKWKYGCFPVGQHDAYRDIVVSSLMSKHKNSLQLLGYCFEFTFPVLICEFPEHGACNKHVSSGKIRELPWDTRLKIAKEIANAVTYLHDAFPRTIIHRDIHPGNVFLDKDWTAKLSNFSLAMLIPEGEERVEGPIVGTCGYVDPYYITTGIISEDVDVYNFGVFMLILLIGRPFYDKRIAHTILLEHVTDSMSLGQCMDIFKPEILTDTSEATREAWPQMEAFLELALRCIRLRKGNTPRMMEVAKELRRIEKSMKTHHPKSGHDPN